MKNQGLLRRLFGVKEDKPVEKPQVEVVASHHFTCEGMATGEVYNLNKELKYPVTQIIFSDGSTTVTCPEHKKRDYCEASYSARRDYPLCFNCRDASV
jgi:hypothetical protein